MILRSQTSEIRVDKHTDKQTHKQTDNVIYYVDRPLSNTAYIPVKCKSLKYVVFMLEIVQKYDVSQNVKSLELSEIIPDNHTWV